MSVIKQDALRYELLREHVIPIELHRSLKVNGRISTTWTNIKEGMTIADKIDELCDEALQQDKDMKYGISAKKKQTRWLKKREEAIVRVANAAINFTDNGTTDSFIELKTSCNELKKLVNWERPGAYEVER